MKELLVSWAGCSPSKAGTVVQYSHKQKATLPCDGSLDAIYCRGVLERLDARAAEELMADIEQSLKPGGTMVLEVADHDAVVDLTNNSAEWRAIVFGPHWKDESTHVRKYLMEELTNTVESFGFDVEAGATSAIPYPLLVVRAKKWALLASWSYLSLPKFYPNQKVLDIGPGAYPLPEATHFADITFDQFPAAYKSSIPADRMVQCDLSKPLPFHDGEFDFVFCSHVFEHLEDPSFAALEISRIGKAGVVVVPSIFKESLFGWEEEDHIWWPLPSRTESSSVLRLAKPELWYQNRLKNRDYSAIMASLCRIGRMDTTYARELRKWFRLNEAKLDVVVSWAGEFSVEIIS